METHKLRMKIGVHEFEAEGPKEVVTQHFEEWKKLIVGQPSAPATPTTLDKTTPKNALDSVAPGNDPILLAVFAHDEKKRLITLRIHPSGERREADAVLLLLYGYRKWESDEAPVTRLTEAMALSGIRVGRIDKVVAPYLREGLILKAGHGKGGKYRLTNTGQAKAEQLTAELSAKVL
jgi:hypothetical protein